MPPARVPKNFRRFLAASCFALATSFAVVAAEPMQLPTVKVEVDVPLVKVGEFKMLERRFGPAAVAHGDHLYIIGGLNTEGIPARTVERFNVKTGKSEIFARLKFPRFWHGAALVGGKIYIIGGAIIGPSLPAEPEEAEQALRARGYNQVARKWQQTGLSEGPWVPTRFVEVLDLATGELAHGVPLPKAVYSFGCVTVGDQIGVVGGAIAAVAGTTMPVVTDRLSIFDPAQPRWTLGPPLPRARETAAVVHGPFVIVPGGYDGASAVRNVHVFDLRNDTWRSATALCRETSAHSAALLDNYLFLFGDYAKSNELLIYNLAKETSETFTLGYTAARHAATVTHERKIYIIGGRPQRIVEPLNAIQVFALRKDVNAATRAKTGKAGSE